jgi:hypothetical protein
VQKIEAPPNGIADAVHDPDEDRHVLGLHEMLVLRRAVAEVVAQFDRLGHRIAEPPERGEDLRLVFGGSLGEVILEDQHLLADIPLDRQILGRDRRHDLPEG